MKRKSRALSGARPATARSGTEESFPIVGVGASAGGLEAFSQLLAGLPLDAGMAFVLVSHLDPARENGLTELLAAQTRMPVQEVTDGLKVEPNHVYVIPSNCILTVTDGTLRVKPGTGARSPPRAIDHFLASLAEDREGYAIGIVLSGTGSDGRAGLEAIKAQGGITFAQDASAKYDEMPRNAVATGCVDYILAPAAMAAELTRIGRHPLVRTGLALPGPDGSRALPVAARTQDEASTRSPLDAIFTMLRERTGVDFALYKPATIERRIMRRVLLGRFASVGTYAAALRDSATEADALFTDILIGVTGFFRNPEAFEALTRIVFPRLVQQRTEEPIRVWTVGCSTGQEAYSIAIAFQEFVAGLSGPVPRLKVFATDLSEALLAKARHGFYANLAGEVSPERLERFFVAEPGGHRVNKSLRDMCVFARQNVISDPPFSRMDLITCRNLMIYLEPEVQKQIFATFHYALEPGGFLFLGASESIGALAQLFEVAERKQKIFQRKAATTPRWPLHYSLQHPARKGASPDRLATDPSDARAEYEALREADRVTLQRYAPPGVLIDAANHIIQFRGPTGRYVEPVSGPADYDVLKMARAGLVLPLRSALAQARKEKAAVRRDEIPLEHEGEAFAINLEVIPLTTLRHPFWLILLAPTEAPRPALTSAARVVAGPTPRIKALERELAATREYLQSLQEQHDAATREIRVSHEEVQSANEELQSINEELETSKEELVSTNEELITVNEEMVNRNADLTRLSTELGNLQVSIDTAVLMLDRDLAVRRFTPPAARLFGLRPDDLGRELTTLPPELDLPTLAGLARAVVDSGRGQEKELPTAEGKWFLVRARPYVTEEQGIGGVVLVMVDIDRLKSVEREVAQARQYAEAIVRTARDPLVVLRADLRVNSASEAYYRLLQTTSGETEGRFLHETSGGLWDIPLLRTLLEDVLPNQRSFNDVEAKLDVPGVGQRTFLLSGSQLEAAPDDARLILLSIEDVTERFKARAAVLTSELRYRRLFETAPQGVLVVEPKSWRVTDANPAALAMLGATSEEMVGRKLSDGALWEDPPLVESALAEFAESGMARRPALGVRRQDGRRCLVDLSVNLYAEDGRTVCQCGLQNVTEQVRTDEALRAADERMRAIFLQAGAGIVEADLNGRVLQANAHFCDIVSRAPEELAGVRIHDLTHPDDRRESTALIAGLVADGGQATLEKRYLLPDGSSAWVRASVTRIDDGAGRGLSLMAVVQDIGERKRLADALRASEEYFRGLAQSLPLSVWTRLPDGRIDFANRRWLEFTGQSLPDLHARPDAWIEAVHPDDRERVIAAYRAEMTGDKGFALEVRLRRSADGEYCWFLHRSVPMRDARGAIIKFVVTSTNINDLKRAQHALAAHAGELEKAVAIRTAELRETIGELEGFSYSVTHDMRAPLRSMRGFADLLLSEHAASLSPEARGYLERIARAAQRMDVLIDDVLTYTRVLRTEITLVPVNLNDLAGELLDTYPDFRAQQERIVIDGPLPVVLGHAANLTLCFSNLLSNALKFVAPGQQPKVTIRAEERGDEVRIWVEDEGIGIGPSDRKRIFQIFERAVLPHSYPGTGIGLALVRKAIEQMHGSLGVEPGREGGSRFWIQLKRAAALA